MELTFPIRGLFVGAPSSKQPLGTSRDLSNVRPLWDGKFIGGQRPGQDKWGDGTQIGAAEQPVVCICSVTVAS